MKILRLKLEKWRGVESRDLGFDKGVTLIEGPNEIGKSTIVEAIWYIFNVMDSSASVGVKAIEPKGQNVGSSVEIEVEVGDFHFVYAKTYNKGKETVLHVSKPRAEQLSGREAHERVEQILDSSAVDKDLWKALLVEQGNEIAGVTLPQSDWLAKAIDAAAGSESPEQDDSDLFTRVQAEYEQYFTKSGKPKKTDLKDRLKGASDVYRAATTAMEEVVTDIEKHKKYQEQIRELERGAPELKKKEQELKGARETLLKKKREVAELAKDDYEHLNSAAEAASADEKLQKYQLFAANLEDASQALHGVEIDPAGLEALRDAESELRMARARLETAMSSVEIAAEDKLQVIFNDDAPLALNAGAPERREFSSDLRVAIPGVANIRISPSRSATELKTGVDECQDVLTQLLAKLGVKDLAHAVAVETKRASDEREAKSWSEKIVVLLGSDTAEDLNDNVERLDKLCKDYLAKRAPEPALPDNLAQAVAANLVSGDAVAVCERDIENQQGAFGELRDTHIDASKQQNVLIGRSSEAFDQLNRAGASGRYEEHEVAKKKLVGLKAEEKATNDRASAAMHLWTVLKDHRDATQKAHGRPLKEGVEELGKIVFGSDFAIEIDDKLSLISRTQGDKTIPFDDLSVGAKEQLGILMRLAAARINSSQGGLPLIIDDALGFADPSRLESMGAAIARAGEDCQIILLSCTPGRFKSVGCDKIEL